MPGLGLGLGRGLGRGLMQTSPLEGPMQTAVRQQIFERLRGLLGTGVPYPEGALQAGVQTLGRQGLGRFPLMPTLGLAALGMGLGMAQPKEAEAAPFPIRPPIRLPKVGKLSSATDLLKGMLLRGKAIREVRVGREPWRYIIFEDGSYMSLKKPWLRTLAAERGRQRYEIGRAHV